MSHVLRIRYFNQHWEGRRMLENKDIMVREIYEKVYESVKKHNLTILRGSVGIGKTTLMYYVIDRLIDEEVKPKNILYVSLEDDICNVKDALKYYESEIRMRKIDGDKEDIYVFIDEVCLDPNWVETIKEYISIHNRIRFLVSSSTRDSIPNDIDSVLIELKPMTFKEYLIALGYNVEDIKFEKIDIRRKYIEYLDYSAFFKGYLRKGGYPGLIHVDDDRYIRGWIKNNIIDRITYKLIPSMKGKREASLAEKLLRILAFDAGRPINYNNIASLMEKDIRTVSNYLEALQTTYIINIVKNKIGEGRGSRKLPKVYLYTPGYAYSLYPEKFNDDEYIGKLVEGLLATHLEAKYYWKRGNKEIGVLWNKDGTEIPIVVKYVRRLTRREIKKVDTILKKIGSKLGIIIVKDSLEFVQIEDRDIWIIPAWLFTLML
jgi:hypothetical protein